MHRGRVTPTSASRLAASSATLNGIAAAPGIAVGRCLVVVPRRVSYVRRQIPSVEIEAEIDRYELAVVQAQDDLRAMGERSTNTQAERSIMEAYVLMLGDETLAAATARHIRGGRRCAEWAVASAISEFSASLAAQPDAYLRERSHDFEFVGERLLMALTGSTSQRTLPRLEAPVILVAQDLSPADLLSLGREHLLAIATETGTRTSHTTIVARALEIPAVCGVTGLLESLVSGDRVVVDGLRGSVVVRPTDEMIGAGEARAQRHQALARHLLDGVDRPGRLASGEAVRVLANLEFSHEAAYAAGHGAEGVGLYRTEFLFVNRPSLPDEEEQLEHYRAVAVAMAGRPVVLRTIDAGNDKPVAALSLPHEANPALGLRAVRLALQYPELALTQLRAIIRASAHGDVRLMVPMIASLREWTDYQRLFARALAEVDAAGHPRAAEIPLGMMIEVPAAAIMVDVLARHCAFLSLGTNDLVQYTMAVDRGSPHLARLASPFDPAVLRLIASVAREAERAGRAATVCGAMAGDPLAAILLVGLGYRSFSVEPSAIPELKEALGRIPLGDATRAAEEALSLTSAEEVELLVASTFAPRLFDLLSGDDENRPPDTDATGVVDSSSGTRL
jgi:phosphotransferase system enzyme I (PtsI)